MMKNVFYLTLEVLFILKTFFLTLAMYKNGLIGKIWLLSKFITTQPSRKTMAVHVLPNVSKSKDNETIKCGQLIEYNMRNTFVKKIIYKMWRRNYIQTFF